VSNQVEIIYSSGRNSKETGEIIRIAPRKSACGIRPYGRLPTLIASLCKLNHVLFGRKKVIASTHYQH
jgi:hypothetical protein